MSLCIDAFLTVYDSNINSDLEGNAVFVGPSQFVFNYTCRGDPAKQSQVKPRPLPTPTPTPTLETDSDHQVVAHELGEADLLSADGVKKKDNNKANNQSINGDDNDNDNDNDNNDDDGDDAIFSTSVPVWFTLPGNYCIAVRCAVHSVAEVGLKLRLFKVRIRDMKYSQVWCMLLAFI